MPKKLDLTGQKFGRLTVIERVDSDKRGQARWKCKCECGNETIVHSYNLRSGNTKTCGCSLKLHLKKALEKLKKDEFKEGTYLALLTREKGKNNTSGTKGVYWDKSNKKWRAAINFKGRCYSLGYFTNKQDAINARKKAEEELFEPILEKYGKKKAD